MIRTKLLRNSLLTGLFLSALAIFAQDNSKQKYQGLLWEITGNNLKKPAYLYGTMHVSSKLAFNLGDSFFIALQNVDVVGLETTPDTWLEDMIRCELTGSVLGLVDDGGTTYKSKRPEIPADMTYALPLSEVKGVADLLSTDPRLINSFMFRKSGNTDNFEEDTYLDLYIFQMGRRFGKPVIGVENFEESQALVEMAYNAPFDKKDVIEGYEDADIDNQSDFYNKFEDAYRRGDLDLLDSLNKLANPGKKYNNYMLWIRNANMVKVMDSVMQTKTMFVGVGAAHLPGDQGVIEMLRAKGYTVRPVKFTGRSEKLKDKYDKIIVPVEFKPYTTSDGLISMEAPGKFTEFPFINGTKQTACTDMANGNYYIVSRMEHLSAWHGQKTAYVLQRVDSLLFENIPGKIIKKKEIENSGYPGLEILNRTRRGDFQRYQIFVTPYEVVIIKLGGVLEYAKGKEADRFFKSVKLNVPEKGWKSYSPDGGGFSAEVPGKPWDNINRTPISINIFNRSDFHYYDENSGNNYFILKKPSYNLKLMEDDSFEIRKSLRSFVMEEKYTIVSQKYFKQQGKTGIEAEVRDRDSNTIIIRSLLKGPFLYFYGVKLGNERKDADKFLQSFHLKDLNSPSLLTVTDSLGFFRINAAKETSTSFDRYMAKLVALEDEKDKKINPFKGDDSRTLIRNPLSGEVVYLDYYRYQRYKSYKDSTAFWNIEFNYVNSDTNMVIRNRKIENKGFYSTGTAIYGDTGSSRALYFMAVLQYGRSYSLMTVIDTNDGPSQFVKSVYESFIPLDTTIGTNLFVDKKELFFQDFASTDSATRARALTDIDRIKFKDQDAPALIAILDSCQFCKGKYEDALKNEVSKLKHPDVLPRIQSEFTKAGDTASIQIKIVQYILNQKTKTGYETAKNYLQNETPLPTSVYGLDNVFAKFQDTMRISNAFFPDLLAISSLPEYKRNVYGLLAALADSGYINSSVYLPYKQQFIVEARNNIKRLATSDKNKNSNYLDELRSELHLLIPFYQEKQVQELFDRAWKLNLNDFKVNLAIRLIDAKKSIPDTVITNLAKNVDSRAHFYALLQKRKKLDLFPKEYSSQDSIVWSLAKKIAEAGYGSNSDSMVYLGKYLVTQRNQPGYIHVFRVKKNYGENWQMLTVGLQPTDTMKVNLFGGFDAQFAISWTKRRDNQEQVDELLDALLVGRRRFNFNPNAYGAKFAASYFPKEVLARYRGY